METNWCRENPSHTMKRPVAINPNAHVYSSWKQTTAPTCTTAAVNTGTCAYDTSHTITTTGAPALGHDSGAWHITLAATCTATGTTQLRCTRDNALLNTQTITAIGHDYQNWTQTTAPTCTTAGVETGTCTHDNSHTTTRAGARALGHDYQYTQTQPPSCTTAAVERGRCSRDSSHPIMIREGAPSLGGHDYSGEWHITLDATCTATGTTQLRCTRDNALLDTQTIPIDPNAHDPGAWHVTLAATCMAAGARELRCTRDNAVLNTETLAIDPNAHNWEWVIRTVFHQQGNGYASRKGLEDGTCTHNPAHIDQRITNVNMVRVEGGSFSLGTNLGNVSGGHVTPVSTVTVSSFYMSRYEMPQELYRTVMGDLPNPIGFSWVNSYPVYYVSWYDAIVFCNKLSILDGLTPAYRINNSTDPSAWGAMPTSSSHANYAAWNAVTIDSGSNGYRLPTEAQWEYAAKGGNPLAPGWFGYTWAGSDIVDRVAYYRGNRAGRYEQPTSIGTKNGNVLELFDMSGNVMEWCWDWYGNYTSGAKTNPTGPSSGENRVLRGGYWDSTDQNVRSVSRAYYTPYSQYQYGGIRLVRPAQ